MIGRPCSKCGREAVRDLGIDAWCAVCITRLFDSRRGVGVRHGGAHPEVGPDYWALKCTACGATWTGPVGEWCAYCAHRHRFADHDTEVAGAHRVLQAIERDALLTMPRFEDDPRPLDVVLCEYGVKLRDGTSRKVITRAEAREAWTKAVQYASTR